MIPKFRAYINKRVGMIWVKRICFYPPFIDFEWENEIGITQTYSEDLDKVKLMQSTGVKDTNGVEIFEGDIVKVTDDDERTDFSDGGIGTICGLDELYMWYIDGQVHNGLFDISRQYYIEVLGNVYENPELLEEEE